MKKHLYQAWSLGVIPLVGDPEASVQSKCIQCISKIVLNPLIDNATSVDTLNQTNAAWNILISLRDDSIRCFQRAVDLTIKSKLFHPSAIANAMQHWLQQGKCSQQEQEDCGAQPATAVSFDTHLGAWIVLEALFFSCSILILFNIFEIHNLF